jgi:hypothetical protein
MVWLDEASRFGAGRQNMSSIIRERPGKLSKAIFVAALINIKSPIDLISDYLIGLGQIEGADIPGSLFISWKRTLENARNGRTPVAQRIFSIFPEKTIYD